MTNLIKKLKDISLELPEKVKSGQITNKEILDELYERSLILTKNSEEGKIISGQKQDYLIVQATYSLVDTNSKEEEFFSSTGLSKSLSTLEASYMATRSLLLNLLAPELLERQARLAAAGRQLGLEEEKQGKEKANKKEPTKPLEEKEKATSTRASKEEGKSNQEVSKEEEGSGEKITKLEQKELMDLAIALAKNEEKAVSALKDLMKNKDLKRLADLERRKIADFKENLARKLKE